MTDTQNPGGWPDAARPGYPQNPERDGLHYITDAVALWETGPQKWTLLFRARRERPEWLAAQSWAEYRGPCLLPSEVAAREAAARREGIEACVAIARERGAWASNDADAENLKDRLEANGRMDMASEIAAAIRALLEDGR